MSPAPSTSPSPIRVFLVDDSAVALLLLGRLLATSPHVQVVGTARNGREALALLEAAQPDVIVTDYHMPVMDGLDLVKHIMAEFPRPILVVSSAVGADNNAMFALLAAGAVDLFAKPEGLDNFEGVAAQLVQKIKILSGVPVISRRADAATPQVLARAQTSAPSTRIPDASEQQRPATTSPLASTCAPGQEWAAPALKVLDATAAPRRGFSGRVVSAAMIPRRGESVRLVAIGASTGGPQTLRQVLSALPAEFPAPILCVQHISVGFLQGMVEWLDGSCRLKVRVAIAGERALPGTIYFAPEHRHLELDAQLRLLHSDAPALGGHRPSATALFQSVARRLGAEAAGVLLTGMGCDGAQGLLEMARAGAATIAQDEATSVVFGMPRVAIEMGAAQWILPAPEVAGALGRLAAPQR